MIPHVEHQRPRLLAAGIALLILAGACSSVPRKIENFGVKPIADGFVAHWTGDPEFRYVIEIEGSAGKKEHPVEEGATFLWLERNCFAPGPGSYTVRVRGMDKKNQQVDNSRVRPVAITVYPAGRVLSIPSADAYQVRPDPMPLLVFVPQYGNESEAQRSTRREFGDCVVAMTKMFFGDPYVLRDVSDLQGFLKDLDANRNLLLGSQRDLIAPQTSRGVIVADINLPDDDQENCYVSLRFFDITSFVEGGKSLWYLDHPLVFEDHSILKGYKPGDLGNHSELLLESIKTSFMRMCDDRMFRGYKKLVADPADPVSAMELFGPKKTLQLRVMEQLGLKASSAAGPATRVGQFAAASVEKAVFNYKLVVDAGADRAVEEESPVELVAIGRDPDGSDATLKYTWALGSSTQLAFAPALGGADTPKVSFAVPNLEQSTELELAVTVSNGVDSVSDSVKVTVKADNDAPKVAKIAVAEAGSEARVIEAALGGHPRVKEGSVVKLSVTAEDPEGKPLQYSWVQVVGSKVVLEGKDTVAPSFTAPELTKEQEQTFRVAVRDGTTQSEESLTIVVEADNDAPTFAVGLDQTVQVRQRVVLDARARDPESQTVAYKWDQVSGPMVSLSQANDPKPSFTAPDSACELVFEVTVGDGETESKTKVSVSVREAPGR